MSSTPLTFEPNLRVRRRRGRLFAALCLSALVIAFGMLLVLLIRIFAQGWPYLSWEFLNRFPSMLTPEKSGVKSALFGTLWLISLTALVSMPVGVAAATYLEEYARDIRLVRWLKLCIANLAGVPSIVYGILGLALFVRWLNFGRSIFAGALTLSLLILPVIIISTREALAGVPKSIRLAALAVGATRWQTTQSHVLPAALPGIMTGTILAISRAIGEAAPLILIGAYTFVMFVPDGPWDQKFTALPVQIYAWSDQAQEEFRGLAAAGILVLLAILLPMNAAAILVRGWQQRKKLW